MSSARISSAVHRHVEARRSGRGLEYGPRHLGSGAVRDRDDLTRLERGLERRVEPVRRTDRSSSDRAAVHHELHLVGVGEDVDGRRPSLEPGPRPRRHPLVPQRPAAVRRDLAVVLGLLYDDVRLVAQPVHDLAVVRHRSPVTGDVGVTAPRREPRVRAEQRLRGGKPVRAPFVGPSDGRALVMQQSLWHDAISS